MARVKNAWLANQSYHENDEVNFLVFMIVFPILQILICFLGALLNDYIASQRSLHQFCLPAESRFE